MNDVDQSTPIVPDPPAPTSSQPSYVAEPVGPGLVDRVLGMRAVIAVALAGLVVGGLGGALLGATTDGGEAGFGGGPGGVQRGTFPAPGQNQFPHQQNGVSDQPGQTHLTP